MDTTAASWLDAVRFGADGLVPAIAQERGSGDVLMVAWMNRDALAATAARGEAVYWSRSRQRLWLKGEESGHVQQVHAIRLDCDQDVVLLEVTQHGRAPQAPAIACHTGRHSCFFSRLDGGRWQVVEPVLVDPRQIYGQPAGRAGAPAQPSATTPPPPEPPGTPAPASTPGDDTLARLAAVIESRRPAAGGDPEKSYVARLFTKGTDAILKKIGEEATEVVMAAKDGVRERLVGEVADLWFHSMIALAQFGARPADVLAELARREGLSGLEEFALRKAREREQERAAAGAPGTQGAPGAPSASAPRGPGDDGSRPPPAESPA